MKDTIYRRRSCRSFAEEPLSQDVLDGIKKLELKPLYPDIRVDWQIVKQEQVRFYMPWRAPQLVAVFSENKPGYLENVGFMLQQLDLALQKMGLGVCWMGLGKPRSGLNAPEGMEFVIFLAFGTPKEGFETGNRSFRRKTLSEISDREDARLECARVAPSSTNSQPWYFVHEGDTLHACCSKAGILRHAMLGTMNRIDMGIALAHLYVEHSDSFRFFTAEAPHVPDGYGYIGSFTL